MAAVADSSRHMWVRPVASHNPLNSDGGNDREMEQEDSEDKEPAMTAAPLLG